MVETSAAQTDVRHRIYRPLKKRWDAPSYICNVPVEPVKQREGASGCSVPNNPKIFPETVYVERRRRCHVSMCEPSLARGNGVIPAQHVNRVQVKLSDVPPDAALAFAAVEH